MEVSEVTVEEVDSGSWVVVDEGRSSLLGVVVVLANSVSALGRLIALLVLELVVSETEVTLLLLRWAGDGVASASLVSPISTTLDTELGVAARRSA